MSQQYPPPNGRRQHGAPPQGATAPPAAPPTKQRRKWWPWVVVVVIAWLFGSVLNGGTSTSAPVASAAAAVGGTPASVAAAPASPPAPPQEAQCYSSAVYNGDGTCRQGGEIVEVRRVVDADTLELVDGRTVRLLAVDAPLAADCAGSGALAFTRTRTEGKKVKLHSELGTDTDEKGNLWRYVAYTDSADTRTNLPIFSKDLGHDLVLAGWAKPVSGGENAEYMSNLRSAADIAVYRPEGMYASPCGEPKVYGDDNGNGTPDYAERADADVYVPDPDPDPEQAPRNRERTGRSGHPCLPGERDGDGDGYCGEGR